MNLIVGGTGFVGGHLAEYFFEQGEISKAIFRKGAQIRILDQCGVQNYEGDLLQKSSLHEPLEDVETVYNLASETPGTGGDADFMSVNSEGLRNLLEEAKEHGVKTIAHLSTVDIYGFGRRTIEENSEPNPEHPYQRAKLEAEKILQAFGSSNPEIKIRVIRAARAVGSRDPTLTLPLFEMMESGEVLLPKGGKEKISFSHPKDIAQALHKAATVESSSAIYLVKSFDASLAELAEVIAKSCVKRATIKQEGVFRRSSFPRYTVDQIRGGLLLKEQESWKRIGYAPAYDARRVGVDVAEWSRKEPWITRES